MSANHRRVQHAACRPPVVLYGITVPESAATLLRGQLSWMRERGWEVHLVTSPGAILDEVEKREGVISHGIKMARDIDLRLDFASLFRWLKVLLRVRPNVVNVGTPKAALLGSIAAWMVRVPRRVYVMRGLRLEGATTKRELALLWLMERLTIFFATDVVCVSHSLKSAATARRLLRRRNRAIVIANGSSNGVSTERWDPGLAAVDVDLVRKGWGLEKEGLVVGFVGRISYDKGVADLCNAFAGLTDLPVRLLLVGPVEDEPLHEMIASLGDSVIHLEWTTDLYPIYAAIDILCLPTKREGFPNVVLEAALAGVPTVTTTATGARDSVVPGVTGWLVAPGDAGALALAIRHAVEDREALRRAGQAARERAIKDFRPEIIWAGLEEIYLGQGKACDPEG